MFQISITHYFSSLGIGKPEKHALLAATYEAGAVNVHIKHCHQ